MLRLVEMARFAQGFDFAPIVVIDAIEAIPPQGIEFNVLDTALIDQIQPTDLVVLSPFLPPIFLHRILQRGIPFDLDFYCVGAFENLEAGHGYSNLRLFQGRRRTAIRYRILLERATKVYLSNFEQLTFLGGMLFQQSDRTSCNLASTLPAKAILAPMGVSNKPFPNQSSPYPEELTGRPIFLWGGGIWSWFDMPTLLEAFHILLEEGSNATLYFLCGSNPSGLSEQDAAVRDAHSLSLSFGILGKNVFFNKGAVPYEALPGYLAHCKAGIMSNPARLESIASWRTRTLDLLWAGKPLVTCGHDPLSYRLEQAGAALTVPAGNARALASAIRSIAEDASTANNMSIASAGLASSMSWPATLASWGERLRQTSASPKSAPIGLLSAFRYILGL